MKKEKKQRHHREDSPMSQMTAPLRESAKAFNWKLALIVVAVILLATVITDFISVGALSTIVVVPLYTGLTTPNPVLVGILCIGTAVMLYKHWENILRIARKEEIGLRSTLKGEKRVK